MTQTLSSSLDSLLKLTSDNCAQRGELIVSSAESAANLELLWLQHLTGAKLTGTADCLLDGTHSAIREGAACVSLGLVRPALASLRLQMDLALGWLYFKDHPVEWERVQATGDGFKLKTELLKYLGEVNDRFAPRMALLKQCKTRTQDDPYRLLSAHIHAQSASAVPKVEQPADIVASPALQDEFIRLQFECSEFINDIFWSVYAPRWASLPNQLLDTLTSRFVTPKQKAEFFQ